MSEVKQQVLAKIRERFEAQGGTGYHTRMEFDGCHCALSAASGYKTHTRSIMELESMGVDRDHAFGLTLAHDEPLAVAWTTRTPGLEYTSDRREFRALIGTPAYDMVMERLEAWAKA